MTIGTVTYFNYEKGFGFVAPAGIGINEREKHCFLHNRELAQCGIAEVRAGAEIEFDVMPPRSGRGKLECQNVRLIAA